MPTKTYTYYTPDGKALDVDSDHPLAPAELRQVFKAAGVDLKLPGEHTPSTGEQIVRGATSALPVMGGVLGGIAGSEVPIAGTIAGVGGGTMLGESLRQTLNQYLYGDKPNPMGSIASGAVNAAGAGALEALPAAGAALSPSGIAEDIAKGGTFASAVPGMIRRAARSLVPGEGPILTRPPWQAAEAPPGPPSPVEPFAPNTGGLPPKPGKPYGNPYPIPIRGGDSAVSAAPGPAPTLVKGGSAPTLSDALRQAVDAAREPMPTTATFAKPGVAQTQLGKPGVTQAEYDALQGQKAQPSSAQPPRAAKARPTLPSEQEGADKLGSFPNDLYGGEENVPRGGNGTMPATAPLPVPATGSSPGQITDQLKGELDRLRRTYGADRIGQAINPNAPETVVGPVVKATGAPSAMPDLAQKALLESLKNPASVKNPGRFMRGLSQVLREYKRNGGVAKSDTARQVADLLKSYGFDVNDETGAITPETAIATGAVGSGVAYGLYKLLSSDAAKSISNAGRALNPFQKAADTLNAAGKP